MTLSMIYLVFDDEAAANAALFTTTTDTTTTDEESGPVPIYPTLQILGPVPMPVSRETGDLDAEGLPVRELVEGYHVNCICRSGDCPAALAARRLYPETPFAVLA